MDEVRELLRRAVTDQRGLAGSVSLSAEAENALVRLSAGPTRPTRSRTQRPVSSRPSSTAPRTAPNSLRAGLMFETGTKDDSDIPAREQHPQERLHRPSGQ
ncbi:hypothetical protein GCM10027073_56210 [Streptomyces chlorus]